MELFYKFDKWLVHMFHHAAEPVGRIGFFIVYFWFGILKVTGDSAAIPLVEKLFGATYLGEFLPFVPFLVLFGIFEMAIGVVFLFPKFERIALTLLTLHLITTVLPLFFLSEATWQGLAVPTLEGQYIIKNIVLVGLAMFTAAHLHPLSPHRKHKK